mmetsp:Transcript_18860/g.58893  ORF Transcript_18860/g.58893 Transcript_18860/m.58893 type:complete len:207 (-) Transcript_18860:1943-2563(-)
MFSSYYALPGLGGFEPRRARAEEAFKRTTGGPPSDAARRSAPGRNGARAAERFSSCLRRSRRYRDVHAKTGKATAFEQVCAAYLRPERSITFAFGTGPVKCLRRIIHAASFFEGASSETKGSNKGTTAPSSGSTSRTPGSRASSGVAGPTVRRRRAPKRRERPETSRRRCASRSEKTTRRGRAEASGCAPSVSSSTIRSANADGPS